MQQVHETKLFNIVRDWLSSCYSNAQSCCDNSSFSEIAASVCCQGAVLLSGGHKEDKGFCCRSTCVKCLNPSEQTPVTIVSGSVISGGTEQKVDMLVPVSPSASLLSSNLRSNCSPASESYFGGHPGSNDVLTVLLLVLPSDTWMGVRDENLQAEIFDLVSTEKLPDVLQQEVDHIFHPFNLSLLRVTTRRLKKGISFGCLFFIELCKCLTT